YTVNHGILPPGSRLSLIVCIKSVVLIHILSVALLFGVARLPLPLVGSCGPWSLRRGSGSRGCGRSGRRLVIGTDNTNDHLNGKWGNIINIRIYELWNYEL